MLRYLQAVLRVAPLSGSRRSRPSRRSSGSRSSTRGCRRAGIDQSIGRIFLEAGEADVAAAAAGTSPAQASAVVAEVLPRYFAALEPAQARAGARPPRVTVTLVRWPYT